MISTFQRLCGSILREHGARTGIRPDFGIADEAEQLDIMRQCMFDASVDIRIWKPQTLVQRMSVLKNMMKDPGSPEAWGKDEHRDRNASLANAGAGRGSSGPAPPCVGEVGLGLAAFGFELAALGFDVDLGPVLPEQLADGGGAAPQGADRGASEAVRERRAFGPRRSSMG